MLSKQLPLVAFFAILSIAFTQNYNTYTYKTADNLSIGLDVYVPSSSPYQKYPVFFVVHGGGFVESSKQYGLSDPERDTVLSLGFVYVTIDYRLNPGVLLPDIVSDCSDAYNWVRTQLVNHVNINPDAIVVMGRSAGGGMSLISGYMFNPRPKAVIAFYPGAANFTDPFFYNPSTPVTQVLSAAANLLRKPIKDEYFASGSVDPYWALFTTALNQNKGGWLLVSSDPNEPSDQVMASLKNYSAVDHVDQNYPPTYLVHGTSDNTVPYSQSVEMANVLKAKNIKYGLDLVSGQGHSFDNSINSVNDPMFQQHILPAFKFAASIIQEEFGSRSEKFLA